jgi:hypothetical protein
MLTGLRGHLVSQHFAATMLAERFAGRLGEAERSAALTRFSRHWRQASVLLGPASGIRAIFDQGAAELMLLLGYHPGAPWPVAGGSLVVARLAAVATATIERTHADAMGRPKAGTIERSIAAASPDEGRLISQDAPGLLVAGWGENLDRAWREAVRHGIDVGSSWCLCFNGTSLRLVDARRTYARSYIEFELSTSIAEPATFAVLWGLLRAAAFVPTREHRAAAAPARSGDPEGGRTALIDEVVALARRHAASVCGSLRSGVAEALVELLGGFVPAASSRRATSSRTMLAGVFEQCLTIVYRILFLLFAEARGLLPVWHPIYRDSYTIESLRGILHRSAPAHGIWETLQAISRLAHAGCSAGDLVVTPFNGRLFSPARTPLAESGRLDDERVRRAMVAVTTRPGRDGREQIAYRDLGVEQLGGVYESLLEYEPCFSPEPERATGTRPPAHLPALRLASGRGRRKATGSFYTPRAITDYLVRRTLHPLIEGVAADSILQLRVLDPAMGSGAFLVGACRYLAAAYEWALVRDGACSQGDIGDEDRAQFRRMVAQRCLFGVDLNPMAVQLARLSLWLATLSAGRPLTFLDHHLADGNSLVGASPDDLARRPPPGCGGSRLRAPRGLPLFERAGIDQALDSVLPARMRMAVDPGDTIEAVREKERALAGLTHPASNLSRSKAIADLWCAGWFWSGNRPAPPPTAFADLAAALAGSAPGLPRRIVSGWLSAARRIARKQRFFHWMLEFPEAFYAPDGALRPDAGFDAVLGNPPWDVVRADAGSAASRTKSRRALKQLIGFTRASGIYSSQSDGHPNQYQLFVERALKLARRGGRVGLVVPWGLVADRGSAALRRLLFDRCEVDAMVGFENSERVFPIHRSVRFLLLSATTGSRTRQIRCRLGERDPRHLDTLPDKGGTFPVVLSHDLVERLSPDLAIPDIRGPADLSIVERLSSSFPPLASSEGWNARFGRELNATDDRRHFKTSREGLPVLEGKNVRPFEVDQAGCRFRIDGSAAEALLGAGGSFLHDRLAYRDVAAATNRVTLIAAIVPGGCVTVHTLFCLKTMMDAPSQAFLCAILNSYVANFLVRLRVSTHLGVATVEQLPVPRPARGSAAFGRLSKLAAALMSGRIDAAARGRAHAEAQALAARLYEVGRDELAHILASFPLVSAAEKEMVMAAFQDEA